jgi:hypothetical protein
MGQVGQKVVYGTPLEANSDTNKRPTRNPLRLLAFFHAVTHAHVHRVFSPIVE